MDKARRRRGRNALLAQPPAGIHGLGVAGGQAFQQAVGRPTVAEDYYGVHTTGLPEIAAVYAMGAWSDIVEAVFLSDEARIRDPEPYPVILTLDVSGLRALPDVDAIARAAYLLEDRGIRQQFEGMDLQEAHEMWEVSYEDVRAGGDVGTAVMEVSQYAGGPMDAFEDDEAWERWVKTGDYTDEEASRLVDQRRYMNDFDWNRVVRVEAMRPWWPWILEHATERGEEEGDIVEAAGWQAVDEEMVIDLVGLLDLKALAEGPASSGDVQFHGTSSAHLRQAFPNIDWPPNPVLASPLDLEEVKEGGLSARALKKKLLR